MVRYVNHKMYIT